MAFPPLSFSAPSSSSARGDAMQTASSNGGEMNINYGSGVSQGGGLPVEVWYVALAIAGLVALKKFR